MNSMTLSVNLNEKAIGVIHGRFQPFHNGHLTYATLARKLCDELIIGITNPDPRSYKELKGDKNRHLVSSNPYSYFERYRMIMSTLNDHALFENSVIVVPFPIDLPEMLKFYIPPDAINYLRDRGEWTQTKIELLKNNGLTAVLLDEDKDLDIHGNYVRDLIISNKPGWKDLVPPGTKSVIENIDLKKRLV